MKQQPNSTTKIKNKQANKQKYTKRRKTPVQNHDYTGFLCVDREIILRQEMSDVIKAVVIKSLGIPNTML